MNQQVVFFVALVCIAQLGVTLGRNFWSEQARQVQHVSLARGANINNVPTGMSESQKRGESANPKKGVPPKRSESAKIVPVKQPVPAKLETPQKVTVPETAVSGDSISSSAAPAVDHPGIKAQLPSPNLTQAPPAPVVAIAQQPISDPFVPFFSIRKDSNSDSNRSLTEYTLDELKVTAIINDSRGGHFASVETPPGRYFIVKQGSMIGSQGGRIVAISPSKIVINEPVKAPNGAQVIAERTLSLKSLPAPEGLVQLN